MGKRTKRSTFYIVPGTLCAYCEANPATSIDHVVPQAIFDVQPSNHIKLPACKYCNGRKSQFEGPFREYLVVDPEGSEHPTAQKLLDGPVYRSAIKRVDRYIRKAAFTPELKPRFDAAGLYLGDFIFIEMRGEVADEVTWITRGLSIAVYNYRIPDNYQIIVKRIFLLKRESVLNKYLEYSGGQFVTVGENESAELFAVPITRPGTNQPVSWLLTFYKAVVFRVMILSPEEVEHLDKKREQERRKATIDELTLKSSHRITSVN